jgi:hypothetical protein
LWSVVVKKKAMASSLGSQAATTDEHTEGTEDAPHDGVAHHTPGHSRAESTVPHEAANWSRTSAVERDPQDALPAHVVRSLISPHGRAQWLTGTRPGETVRSGNWLFGSHTVSPEEARRLIEKANLSPGKRSWIGWKSFFPNSSLSFIGMPVTNDANVSDVVAEQARDLRTQDEKEAKAKKDAINRIPDASTRSMMKLSLSTNTTPVLRHIKEMTQAEAQNRSQFLLTYVHSEVEGAHEAVSAALHAIRNIPTDAPAPAHARRAAIQNGLIALLKVRVVRFELDGLVRGGQRRIVDFLFRPKFKQGDRTVQELERNLTPHGVTIEQMEQMARHLQDELKKRFAVPCLTRFLHHANPNNGGKLYALLFATMGTSTQFVVIPNNSCPPFNA